MQLPEDIKARINNALNDGYPLSLVAVSPDAEPLVSFRGSAQSFETTRSRSGCAPRPRPRSAPSPPIPRSR